VPASKEVILDPDEFTQSSDDRYPKAKIHAVVGQDGLRKGILDVAHAYAEEHVIDVEWIPAAGADMHLARGVRKNFCYLRIGETHPTLSKYSHFT